MPGDIQFAKTPDFASMVAEQHRRTAYSGLPGGDPGTATITGYDTAGFWWGDATAGMRISKAEGILLWGSATAFRTRATMGGVDQCYMDSTGAIMAGAGQVRLDASGVSIIGASLGFYDTYFANLKFSIGYNSVLGFTFLGGTAGVYLSSNAYIDLACAGTSTKILISTTDISLYVPTLPNADNSVDLGNTTGPKKFRSGYFGTAIYTPALDGYGSSVQLNDHMIPDVDNAVDLGTSTGPKNFRYAYIKNIVTGNLANGGTTITLADGLTPSADITQYIGTSLKRLSNIYSQYGYINKVYTDEIQELTGSAQIKLSSPLNANNQKFYGMLNDTTAPTATTTKYVLIDIGGAEYRIKAESTL